MRIISSFRDYYDTVQSQGQDLRTIYYREPLSISYGRDNYPFGDDNSFGLGWYYEQPLFRAEKYYIGFCGKIYPMLNIVLSCDSRQSFYCYSIEDVDFIISENFRYKEQANYHRYNGMKSRRMGRRDKFAQYFQTPCLG